LSRVGGFAMRASDCSAPHNNCLKIALALAAASSDSQKKKSG
jgi:hypothetical protein